MNILRKCALPGTFFALVFLVFGRSLFHGFAPVDDSFLIVNNLDIRSFSFEHLKHIFSSYDPELYIPLVFVSFQINYLIGELNPFGFHFFNLLLHAANAYLVFQILVKLSGKRFLSIIAGLIFAVHPLNAEAAVWLAGRKDLLMAFFFFLSLMTYLDWREGKRGAYMWSIIFFLLALLSKVVAVTLIGVIGLHYLLIEDQRLNVNIIKKWIPFLVLGIIFSIIAIGGKGRVIESVSTVDKILVASKSSIFYLQKFFVPTELTMVYPLQGKISLSDPGILIPFILFLALIGSALWLWKRAPWFTFAVLCYIGMLAPTYFNIGKAGLVFFAVDRYAYLPLFLILFVLIKIIDRISPSENILRIGSVVIIVIFMILANFQASLWRSSVTLFEHNLKLYPESVGVRVGLASILRGQNKTEEAFAILLEGLNYLDHMLLHLHAGYVYASTGQVGDAEEQFTLASKMEPDNPEPIFALGSLFEQTNRKDEAFLQYEKAVELDESYVIARAKLGNLYLERGEIEKALNQFTIALDWNPSSVEAREGMEKIEELQQE